MFFHLGWGDKCEVKDKDGNQFEVDMKNKTCSCRKWQLTGIPCCHGCQAILSINAEPETYMNDCFKKDTYMRAYSHLMCPMKGSKEWPIAQQVKLFPPKARRMPGRPKKHRRREADEEGSGTRLSKKGIVMKCSRCLLIGHNKATCKTDESEVIKNHKKAAEAKKAQGEAAKAHSLRNKQNVRKKPQVSHLNVLVVSLFLIYIYKKLILYLFTLRRPQVKSINQILLESHKHKHQCLVHNQ